MAITFPSPTTALPPFLLANSNLLSLLESIPFYEVIEQKKVEEALYLAYQPWKARNPDHVFRSHWSLLQYKQEAYSGWVLPVLKTLADEYLCFHSDKLHAKLATFGEWQNLLSRISALPIHAAAYAIPSVHNRMGQVGLPNNNGIYTLIYPYEPVVESYIAEEGLHETHLHLNGTTSAEWCWLRALYNPRQELKDFSEKYTKSSLVKELCHTINPELTPITLYSWLRKARLLRCWLMAIADGRAEQYIAKSREQKKLNEEELGSESYTFPPCTVAELLALENNFPFVDEIPPMFGKPYAVIEQEFQWLHKIIQQLNKKSSLLTDRLLHLYLLIQNQYLQLVVQREDMYGFDQFQKYTLTDLREPAETQYLYRFLQLSGANKHLSRIGWLEGRFAPKSELKKNEAILSSILKSYLDYLLLESQPHLKNRYLSLTDVLNSLREQIPKLCPSGSRKYFKLTLVVHFIKLEWKPGKYGYRHQSLRSSLKLQCDVLQQTLKNWPDLLKWIRGIDAAANELHASPEVFAPFYRACRQYGIYHRSYHVGEDFPHLISGIRQVFDAITLLDLQVGDRIGHGTAVGIDPSIWITTMPSKLAIKQGEWLLDLLGTWNLLRAIPECYKAVQKIKTDISRLIHTIFQMDISCEVLLEQMKYRGLLPQYVFEALDNKKSWDWQTTSFSDVWREEARLVENSLKETDLKILSKWWRDPELIERSEKLIDVETAYLNAETLIILQQTVLHEISQKRIVIETLPTSNVRISQYQHYRDHHALRWMKIEGYEKVNDPRVAISLGSDDPGIFANDIMSDFYHLYAVLIENGLSDKEAIESLVDINKRGEIYRFHDPQLFG